MHKIDLIYGPTEAHTPLMRQWLAFKKEISEGCLLFFRVGDFYELFWEDAERASILLDLQTAKRGESAGRPVLMAGVPWHALDSHLSKLVRLGETAAVVDQIGDPALAKGPVERAIARIITPGTILDDALLEEKNDAPLMSCAFHNGKIGYFWMSVASGRGRIGRCNVSDLHDEIGRISPAEILFPEGCSVDFDIKVKVNSVHSWRFDPQRGRDALFKHFSVSNLSSFGLNEDSDLELAAFCAAYTHLTQSLGGRKPFISTILREESADIMQLDISTRKALEIVETQRGERSPSLLSVLDRCSTHMGSRRMKDWLSNPSGQSDVIKMRHLAVSELRTEDSIRAKGFRDATRGICDIERISARLAAGSSRPRDFSNLRMALTRISGIRDVFKDVKSDLLNTLIQSLDVPNKCLEMLTTIVSDEPPSFLKDGGVIRPGYSQELDELKLLSENIEALLEKMQERERELTGIPNLRIEFNRARGFQIEVSKSNALKVPAHYRRNQTLKNVERYTTEELDELAMKAIGAQEQALKLEKRLFEDFVIEFASFSPVLTELALKLSILDVLCSFALVSEERGYVAPQISETPQLDMIEGKHPVAADMLGEEYIPNNVNLSSAKRSLVVTGPNMGGKSTYMRSAALAAIMSQAGCHVPASMARLSVFDRVCARVGASDDISKGQSTFMVEMVETAGILRKATPRSLCIIDEIGRGTSTFDGMSIAWASLRHLHEINRCLTLFSTHYFEITDMAATLSGCDNRHMTVASTDDGVVFLHKLAEGPAEKSHGIDVAKIAGIPDLAILWARQAHDMVATPDKSQGSQNEVIIKEIVNNQHKTLFEAFSVIDPDTLTPRDALDIIYKLKRLCDDEKSI